MLAGSGLSIALDIVYADDVVGFALFYCVVPDRVINCTGFLIGCLTNSYDHVEKWPGFWSQLTWMQYWVYRFIPREPAINAECTLYHPSTVFGRNLFIVNHRLENGKVFVVMESQFKGIIPMLICHLIHYLLAISLTE